MISGGRIIGVEAKKLKEGKVGGMAVNIGIEDVRVDGDKLVIAYSYAVDYQPELATMSIRGEIFMDEKNRQDIVDKWKKNKQFPPEMAEDMLNAITYAASAVGTLLAFALGINAPLSLPRARVAQPPQAPPAQQKKAS